MKDSNWKIAIEFEDITSKKVMEEKMVCTG